MFKRTIFVFLDGVGLGSYDDNNPFCVAKMPFMDSLIEGPFTKETYVCKDRLLLKGIDACLGVDGIPQSATGQTSLFTGKNASEYLGRHLTAFPNKPLIELIKESSILKLASEKGLRSTFANAYTPDYFLLEKQGLRIHSVTTHCVFAANQPFRSVEDLLVGEAVYWDFTNRHLKANVDESIPLITPYSAGKRLADLTRNYELVLYECFLPDLIGHQRDLKMAIDFLEDLDSLLQGIVENMCSGTSLLVTSDHGNIEDLSKRHHTYNHVPMLVVGDLSNRFTNVDSITDVLGAMF